MLWFQDTSFRNRSFEEYPKENYSILLISLVRVLNHFL